MDWHLVSSIVVAIIIAKSIGTSFGRTTSHCHKCEDEKKLQALEDQAIIDSAYGKD